MIEINGRVRSGRGVAAPYIAKIQSELERVTNEAIVPGTLNIILDRPLRLNEAGARLFDQNLRMLWPATLNGTDVWVHRWKHTALHVVEVLSCVHLRNRFDLKDGDRVTLTMRPDDIDRVGAMGRTAWAIVWIGRRDWCYTNDRYYFGLRRYCKALGATQQSPRGRLKNVLVGSAKAMIKRSPIIRTIARIRPKRRFQKKDFAFSYQTAVPGETRREQYYRKVCNLLAYTKKSNSPYSAQQFPAGYHTINFDGHLIQGQRNPNERLALVPFDFSGKAVLDIGSNQGGMVLQLADKIRWGIGVDYDHRLVNVANWIAQARSKNNLRFYVFDLEKEPLELIADFLPEAKADICLLLSVCTWIRNWREVIDVAGSLSNAILFESTGTDQQQDEQLAYLQKRYGTVTALANASLDDPRQKRRKLFLLTDPI